MSDPKGFTMAELLVSVLVLSVILPIIGGFCLAQVRVMNRTGAQEDRARALGLLEKFMRRTVEEVSLETGGREASGPWAPGLPVRTVRLEDLDGRTSNGAEALVLPGPGGGILRVTLVRGLLIREGPDRDPRTAGVRLEAVHFFRDPGDPRVLRVEYRFPDRTWPVHVQEIRLEVERARFL